jgi:hypothetical protein
MLSDTEAWAAAYSILREHKGYAFFYALQHTVAARRADDDEKIDFWFDVAEKVRELVAAEGDNR